uniref:Uncharacterized protein n=1 Tax=Daphnia galeata TaxID=27404 RepID=A0A8J2W9X5_9CRUS|nr:unnamed protein product [Daphnia galeata]
MGKTNVNDDAVNNDATAAEKRPFLESGPESVKLTPSWEDRNLPAAELNLRGLESDLDKAALDMDPPPDRLNLVYLTFILHGIGTLMPWNMFITAKDYFVIHKLGQENTGQSLAYAANFLQFLGFASQVPNVIFNWLNIFIQIGGSLSTRIIGGILVEVAVFVLTVVLAMLESSQWPGAFFWTTMGSVVILNMAGGIYQNTIYGMSAKLPFKYTGAVVLGSNISGTFTAVINVISLALAPNARTSAIYYFIAALFILLACFDSFFALPLNRFYRYNEQRIKRQEQEKSVASGGIKARPPYWMIFKKCFPQCLNVFLVFFVTLSIFPAVYSDIKMVDENFIISQKYFVAVCCFLSFNFFAMVGNMLPGLYSWPGPRWLWIPVVLRVLFIPFFLLCNYQPLGVTRALPVLIDNDWAYWIGGIFLGVTSGYYSSLAMMYCPRTVEPEYAATAGMFGAACLITGIFGGINFSLVMPILVESIAF